MFGFHKSMTREARSGEMKLSCRSFISIKFCWNPDILSRVPSLGCLGTGGGPKIGHHCEMVCGNFQTVFPFQCFTNSMQICDSSTVLSSVSSQQPKSMKWPTFFGKKIFMSDCQSKLHPLLSCSGLKARPTNERFSSQVLSERKRWYTIHS